MTEKVLTKQLTAFFTALILGALLAILGLMFLDKFVRMLGATETIAPYAKDYAKYILIATPYMCCSFVLNNIIRSQGNAFLFNDRNRNWWNT